jgi:hypothetical protein
MVSMRFADTGRYRRPAPRVDFSRHMLAIVAGGPGSGCHNATHYVQRVVERRDSVLVDMRPRAGAPLELHATCARLVHSIDIVRIPRSSKPVVFLGHPAWLPPAARWLDPPDLKRLEQASEEERGFFLRAWARDPRTPPGVAVAMARMPEEWIWRIAGDLLKRPDVQRDPLAVASLAVLRGPNGVNARRLLFDRHATALLRYPRTPLPALGALVEELATRVPRPEPVAFALARHPGVQGDRLLLLRLIRAMGTLDGARSYACGIYVRKFPSWSRWSDTSRRGADRWSHVIGCESLPAANNAQAATARPRR